MNRKFLFNICQCNFLIRDINEIKIVEMLKIFSKILFYDIDLKIKEISIVIHKRLQRNTFSKYTSEFVLLNLLEVFNLYLVLVHWTMSEY